MKKSYIAMTLAVILAVIMALPLGCGESGELTKVRLNEVTHSVFYARCMWPEMGFFTEEGSNWSIARGRGPIR